MLDIPLSIAAAFIVGIFIHHSLFIHGEWHLRAPAIVVYHAASFLGLLALGHFFNPSAFFQNLYGMNVLGIAYLGGLFISIGVYRLFFHCLSAFPGPRLAALSKLWHVWKCRHSRGHHVLEDWHQTYGTFVRTGPNEITIFHPAASEIMDGPKSGTMRSDWYDVLYPRIFSVFTRNKVVHSARRRLWDQAMNSASLASYYKRLAQQANHLEGIISELNAQPVLMNDLISWFAFDCMGDFGFGKDFGMMKKRGWIDAVIYMHSSWSLLGVFSPAIWLPRIAFVFMPVWKVAHWFKALEFSDGLLDARMINGVDQPDIVSAFIEDYEQGSKDHLCKTMLDGDAGVLMFTGSDTTSATLTILMYYIALHPQHATQIQEELKDIDITNVSSLTALPHLTGTINESMRLLPAALTISPGSRITPPEGLSFNGTYIPGGVKLCTSRYSIGRMSNAYEDPLTFIPERWYSRPELIKDRRAFAPFGIGRYGCVGKPIAMAQLRLVVACLLSKYHISFAPGEGKGEAVERGLKDQATANPGPLVLSFRKRPE